ncbi:MAG: amino acid decarboxylase [Alicyclobacillus sp.]|nr:amino acid decarboxylase [Alicyclobacillus sp.]
MELVELLKIERDDVRLMIDARDAIRKGFHPRHEISKLVDEAPSGTLCEIHVPHRTGPLIAALEGMGLNVAVSEVEPGHWRLRVMKI